MNAAESGVLASAQNIANLNTPGYQRQVAASATSADGGVSVQTATASAPGSSLDTDVLGLIQSKDDFAVNLAVFRSGDRMLGALLDLNS